VLLLGSKFLRVNSGGGGGGVDVFKATGFGLEDAGSGKTFCRKSAIAFIRVLRFILALPIFLRNLTHFS